MLPSSRLTLNWTYSHPMLPRTCNFQTSYPTTRKTSEDFLLGRAISLNLLGGDTASRSLSGEVKTPPSSVLGRRRETRHRQGLAGGWSRCWGGLGADMVRAPRGRGLRPRLEGDGDTEQPARLLGDVGGEPPT